MRRPPTSDSHGVRKLATCHVEGAVAKDLSLSDQTAAMSRHSRAGLMSAYNGSRIAEGRTRTLDHAAPSSRDRARKLGTFPHQADIGVRGIGSTKVAAFKSAAHALTAVITD